MIVAAGLSGCGKNADQKTKPITVTDDANILISFDTLPRKIISMAPNVTEAIYSLSADTLLAGVTDLCDFPPEAKSKRPIGNYLSPDLEAIITIKPDLAVMYATNTSGTTYKALTDNGIRVYLSSPTDIEGIKKMFRDLGILTGRERAADSMIRLIDNVVQSPARNDLVSDAFILISSNPVMTANGKTFISEVCGIAGFRNMYKDIPVEYPVLSREELISDNPDFIILPVDTTDKIRAEEMEKETKKLFGNGENLKIVKIDDDIIFRPGPRIVLAIEYLRSQKQGIR